VLAATTNYAAVVRPLQVLVMVVAILFFARVLRVAVVESRPAQGAKKEPRRRNANLALQFIEPKDLAKERVAVDPFFVIGRSLECELSIADTYLSSRHARFANDQGDLTVEDFGSTNGTYVNQTMVHGRVHLEKGDVVQVGGVLFEVVR
jgi:pSer/pThr/pTyr-binding forkhead associated (FHA) protein